MYNENEQGMSHPFFKLNFRITNPGYNGQIS